MAETHIEDFEATDPETESGENLTSPGRRSFGLNLFWRTFFLLSLLLLGTIAAWLQTLRSFEFEPRAKQTAQQIATQIHLSRAALIHSDAINRLPLLKTMRDEEGIRIVQMEPEDTAVALPTDAFMREVTQELAARLGKQVVIASQVNGQPGLWIGFDIDGDDYWLVTDLERIAPSAGRIWIIWLGVAIALSLAGATLIARRINRPLRELSFAASRVREGDFEASRLDEHVQTSEIREVNIGFNRMAQRLAKIEQDRAIMLAGISHDLRTPLARLRLETEMSVADADARAYMAADIDQLDAIIDKFLDYARPDKGKFEPVALKNVVEACVYSFKKQPDVRISVRLDEDLVVMADEVELGRVITNLLENARRYGKTPDTGIARIDIAAIAKNKWVLIKIRDYGMGVPPEQIANLTKPFYRGESARTAANGAGLGLAIVDKTIQRMGGLFAIANVNTPAGTGLSANFKLMRALRDV